MELQTRYALAPRRGISCAVLSDMGWIEGTFVIPKLHSFVDYLNSTTAPVKLTNVAFPGLDARIAFFALAQHAYTLIVPQTDDEHVRSVAPRALDDRHHSISCVFAAGWISGTLETARSLRVSDFLGNGKDFFLLYDCAIHLRGQASRVAPVVIVNRARILGVSDPSIEDARRAHALAS